MHFVLSFFFMSLGSHMEAIPWYVCMIDHPALCMAALKLRTDYWDFILWIFAFGTNIPSSTIPHQSTLYGNTKNLVHTGIVLAQILSPICTCSWTYWTNIICFSYKTQLIMGMVNYMGTNSISKLNLAHSLHGACWSCISNIDLNLHRLLVVVTFPTTSMIMRWWLEITD